MDGLYVHRNPSSNGVPELLEAFWMEVKRAGTDLKLKFGDWDIWSAVNDSSGQLYLWLGWRGSGRGCYISLPVDKAEFFLSIGVLATEVRQERKEWLAIERGPMHLNSLFKGADKDDTEFIPAVRSILVRPGQTDVTSTAEAYIKQEQDLAVDKVAYDTQYLGNHNA